MAELTFKSAGVSTREIDLSGPTKAEPSGIPAGIIGTAVGGPAFVPISFGTWGDFVARFGGTDGEKFGPLAMYDWMRNSQAGTYIRILGAGDGTQRTSSGNNTGKVTRAGFVVGTQQVESNGKLGRNPGVGLTTLAYSGSLGRSYMLGCFMSQSDGSSIFTNAGMRAGSDTYATMQGSLASGQVPSASMPILRGVLLAPSGVLVGLSSSYTPNNAPAFGGGSVGAFFSGSVSLAGGTTGTARKATAPYNFDAGLPVGDIKISNSQQDFVLFLNGHKPTGEYPNVISASFDPNSKQYLPEVLNTDPLRYENAGHLLYAHWDIYPKYAVPRSTGLVTQDSDTTSLAACAFVVSSSQANNTGTATVPNFEGYEDRFQHARTPWVTSQDFGGKASNLFRLHLLEDGAAGNVKYKVSIENITKVTNALAADQYGKFDLLLRSWRDNDRNPQKVETYRGLSLDPGSDRYIGRAIGDKYLYWDFDKKASTQKLVVEGLHANQSTRVRVEVDSLVRKGDVDARALPCGFRGARHLVTSGSSIVNNFRFPRLRPRDTTGQAGINIGLPNALTGSSGDDILRRVVQPPVPFRRNIAVGQSPRQREDSGLYWGVQFEVQDSLAEPNKSDALAPQMSSWTKYFPEYQTSWQAAWVGDNAGVADAGGTVLDSDAFGNNRFTLERVQVKTQSNDTPDPKEWAAAAYRRDGSLDSTLASSRFLNVEKDFGDLATRKYLKFNFFFQGGFDGVNIFNEDQAKITNTSAIREMLDSNQGLADGPTIKAYKKAIDVMAEKANADIKLLVVPGARHEEITDYAIDAVEDRFDAMYIMDLEERDVENNVVTSSVLQKVGVTNTANAFSQRNLDSSFAATYFPDVVVTDPTTRTNVQVPPSTAIIGAYALNDAIAHPWFAPAGFTRGALKTVVESQVKLSRNNLDTLYDADINPITSFPHTPGVVAFGQKTLLAAASALDRVNVRRLLIEIRRQVKGVANKILFEPNREDTLNKFSAMVQPILARIQQQQGLDRFKVIIDTTTTTQADVQNNTIRGKIFLQPTRSIEFISLDFVVTNAGAQI